MAGLARLGAWMLWGWGMLALGLGLWHLSGGEPESNLFSVQPWTIVTREAWRRFAGFEMVYGAACLALGTALAVWARRLPEWVERPVGE